MSESYFPGLTYARLKHFVYESEDFTSIEKNQIDKSNVLDGSPDYSPADLQSLPEKLRDKLLWLHALRSGFVNEADSSNVCRSNEISNLGLARFVSKEFEKPEPEHRMRQEKEIGWMESIGLSALCMLTLGASCMTGCASPSFEDIAGPGPGTPTDGGASLIVKGTRIYVSSMVWSGAEYGVVWLNADENVLNFTRINENGYNEESTTTPLSNESLALGSSLVWTGTEYGLLWLKSGIGTGNPFEKPLEVHFFRIDLQGNKVTDRMIFQGKDASEIRSPQLVSTGTEFGLAWINADSGEIHFVRLDKEGNRMSSETIVTKGAPLQLRLVGTGHDYLLVWIENAKPNKKILFKKIDSNEIGYTKIIAEKYNLGGLSLAWAGDELGLGWVGGELIEGTLVNETYFGRTNAKGDVISTKKITRNGQKSSQSSEGTAVVWAGTQYGIAWDGFSTHTSDFYFALFDKTTNQSGGFVHLTNSLAGYCLVWTGRNFGLSWGDSREDGQGAGLYLSKITPR